MALGATFRTSPRRLVLGSLFFVVQDFFENIHNPLFKLLLIVGDEQVVKLPYRCGVILLNSNKKLTGQEKC